MSIRTQKIRAAVHFSGSVFCVFRFLGQIIETYPPRSSNLPPSVLSPKIIELYQSWSLHFRVAFLSGSLDKVKNRGFCPGKRNGRPLFSLSFNYIPNEVVVHCDLMVFLAIHPDRFIYIERICLFVKSRTAVIVNPAAQMARSTALPKA